MVNKQNLIDRFIRYVKIDTTSDENSTTFPSTKKQFDLANVLVKELEALGLKDISLDEWGYVMATLPANTDKKIPVIGFLAHMDTAPDMSGTNVNPRFVDNYDGKDIILHKELDGILGANAHYIITKEENTTYEKGYIDKEYLVSHVTDFIVNFAVQYTV